jgi:hypothetical protein
MPSVHPLNLALPPLCGLACFWLGRSWERQAAPVAPMVAARAVESVSPTLAPTEPGPASRAEAERGTPQERLLKVARFLRTATAAEARDYALNAPSSAPQLLRNLALIRWAELDPRGCLESPYGWWARAKVDPELAWAECPAELAADVVFSIAQDNPGRAEELLRERPELALKKRLEAIVEGWARVDPEKGVNFALAQDAPPSRALAAWLERDADAALAWAKGLEDADQRARMLNELVGRLSRQDPERAAAEAASLREGEMRDVRLQEAISALARKNPAAAAEAVKSAPDGLGRDLARLGLAAASRDPAALEGVDWGRISEKHGPAQPTSDPLWLGYRNSLGELMAAAPEAVSTRIAQAGEAASVTGSMAMQQWAALEPEKASAWLRGQPAGPSRDNAIRGLTCWLTGLAVEPDFPAALAWANNATDTARGDIRRTVMGRWAKDAPDEARRALEGLNATEEERASLRALLPP